MRTMLQVNRWLGGLLGLHGDDIYRMKGILSVRGDDRRFVFQVISRAKLSNAYAAASRGVECLCEREQ